MLYLLIILTKGTVYNANITGLSTKLCGTPKLKYEEEFMKKFMNKTTISMNKLEAIR